MTQFSDYQNKYECAKLERSESGVLEVTLHTNGGELILDETTHRELPELFTDLSLDRDNKVMILTGTGDNFCCQLAGGDWDFTTAEGWDYTYWEGRRLMQTFESIPIPIISAMNGPARVHAEIPVLCDIVLASDTTELQDIAHFGDWNVVPGDGTHLVWPLLLGINRGKYFLLTQQSLSAQEAKDLGVINEVLPKEKLLPRARELAEQFAAKDKVTLRFTRVAINMLMKSMMGDSLSHGLALEGYSVMEQAIKNAAAD